MDDKTKKVPDLDKEQEHKPLISDDIMDYIRDVVEERIAIEGPVIWE